MKLRDEWHGKNNLQGINYLLSASSLCLFFPSTYFDCKGYRHFFSDSPVLEMTAHKQTAKALRDDFKKENKLLDISILRNFF